MPKSYQDNRILSLLPVAAMAEFSRHMTPTHLAVGSPSVACDLDQNHLYFPIDCIIALLRVTPEDSVAQVAVVGNEGVAGVAVVMGGDTLHNRIRAQSAGYAFKVRADFVREQIQRPGPLQEHFMRYALALIAQVAQTAMCNRQHNIEQQLCRWLLMSFDRLPGDELIVTQAMIASMLGVRRESVTDAAIKLQDAGAIVYRRGHMELLDRALLERMSCECYSVVHAEFARLLGPWLPVRRHTQPPTEVQDVS